MSLIKSYTLVGSATLASRLTGFVRDILIAAVLGSSAVADAYIAAFLLPNLFRRVLSEGAFNATFVPIYARRKATGGQGDVDAFAEAALSGLVALMLVFVVASELAMPLIIAAVAPGFTGSFDKFADAVLFGRIAFVFIGAIVVTALLSSILNAVGRYALVAVAPLVLNLMFIPVLLVLLALGWRGEFRAGFVMVLTVLAAGVVQLLYVAWGIRKAEVKLRLARPRADRDVRQLLILLLPGLVLAGSGHFNMVVAAQLSSALPSAVSWLYYADRLFQLPLGFVAASIGVVLLPEVARALREGNEARANEAGNRALEFGLLLVLPAAVALIILAQPIVDIIYRHGAFTPADAAATAEILSALALALPGFVLVKVFLPPFLAREAMRVPIIAALCGIGVNIVVTLVLLPGFRHVAAPLGVAASAWVNALVLALGLWRGSAFHIDALASRALPRIVLSACITGLATWGLLGISGSWLAAAAPFALRMVTLCAVCLAGIAVHLFAVHLTGAADVGGLKQLLRRKSA